MRGNNNSNNNKHTQVVADATSEDAAKYTHTLAYTIHATQHLINISRKITLGALRLLNERSLHSLMGLCACRESSAIVCRPKSSPMERKYLDPIPIEQMLARKIAKMMNCSILIKLPINVNFIFI